MYAKHFFKFLICSVLLSCTMQAKAQNGEENTKSAVKRQNLVGYPALDFISLGFSQHGDYYLFGQLGFKIATASAQLNILDVNADRYVANSPILLSATHDSADAYNMWWVLLNEHHKLIDSYASENQYPDTKEVLNPGILLWSMAPSQLGDGSLATWRGRFNQLHSLRLEVNDQNTQMRRKDCLNGKTFNLNYKSKNNNEILVYKDKNLPKSRQCATNYRLRAIYTAENNPIIAIIAVYYDSYTSDGIGQQRYESYDIYDYIAIPISLPID
ncbi:DUF2259 domain-containing protein [Bartonella sp. HY038]|uniref:DUF2259 domain-containing protein n=1 Tax=Bartonella sp. HY038 TaxID=2759660 RepID=UPI0015F7B54F|nr:DUF2259 domain-containing protein [Bartonella sp. HY038]